MLRVGDVLRQKDTQHHQPSTLRETVAIAVTLMNLEKLHALVVKDVYQTEGNVVVGVFSEEGRHQRTCGVWFGCPPSAGLAFRRSAAGQLLGERHGQHRLAADGTSIRCGCFRFWRIIR